MGGVIVAHEQQKLLERMVTPVAMAIGQTERAKDFVHKLYSSRKHIYNEYEQSSIEESELFFVQMYSIKYTKQLREIYTILKKAVEDKEYKLVYPIIKKTHYNLYKVYTENAYVDNYAVMQTLVKEQNISEYSEWEIAGAYSIAVYMALTVGRVNSDMNENITYIKMAQEYIGKEYNTYQMSIKGEHYEQAIPSLTKEEQVTYDYIAKNYTFNKSFHINKFMDCIIDKEHAAQLGVQDIYNEATSKMRGSKVADARHQAYLAGGDASIIGAVTGILKIYGFFESKYTQVLSTKETHNFLVYATKLYHGNNLRNNLSIETFLIILSFSMQILEELELSTKLYNKELTSNIENEIQVEYEDKIKLLEKELQDAKKENAKLSQRNASLLER